MNSKLKSLLEIINSKLFLYITIFILAIIFINTCSNNHNLKNEQNQFESNIIAIQDKLKIEIDKNGKSTSTILAYQSSEEELKLYNKELYNKIKEQSGKIVTFNHMILKLIQDTTELRKYIKNISQLKPIKENDSTYNINWILTYNYDSINYDKFLGKTSVVLKGDSNYFKYISLNNKGTEIIKRETQIDLIYGQKWENKKLKVFVESSYPGFTPSSLEGVYINKHTKHWFNGWSINIGISPSYNFVNNKPAIVIGPCIGYNIYNW